MKKILVFLLAIIFVGVVGYAGYYYVPWPEQKVQDEDAVGLDAKVGKIAGDCDTVTGWYFNYNEKVEALSEKVSGWEVKISEIGKKLSGVTSRLSDLSRRFRGRTDTGNEIVGSRRDVETSSAKVSTETKKLSQEVQTTSDQLAQMKTTMTGMRQDLHKLKGEMAPIVSRVSGMGDLKVKTRSQAVEIERLKKQVELLSEQVGTLKVLLTKSPPD